MSNGAQHGLPISHNEWEDAVSPPIGEDSAQGLHFSDSDEEEGDDQMSELFEDETNESEDDGDTSNILDSVLESDEEGEEEEEFVYTGLDSSDGPVPYRDQLRDVLGQEHEEESVGDPNEAEKSLLLDADVKPAILLEDEPLEEPEIQEEVLSEFSPSLSSPGPLTPPSRIGSPAALLASPRLARPFLHPNVSRLRSYAPQSPSGLSKNESIASSHSHLFEGASPSPSHFSSISRSSSLSNLRAASSNGGPSPTAPSEVFRWSELQLVTKELYSKGPQKAMHVLGTSDLGSPTVLAANGLICVGLTDGRICVYDFKQTLKAICGSEAKASILGPVTALALSHDHTCVASGHATGHIQLFDLKKPQAPIRSVPPTTLGVVATGRKEGHIHGSRIVSMGFIAGRHTALVSADENGLAFYHSLGKMLFVEASDILRILGQYPEIPPVASPKSAPPPPPTQKRKVRYTVLSMAPLPLGPAPHPTDAYDVVALLTPTKLVVVGLRPTPKTWFKCPRLPDEGHLARSQMKGTMAWFPSVPDSHADHPAPSQSGTTHQTENIVGESKFKQRVRSTKTGRMNEVDIGAIVFEEAGLWSADETILALTMAERKCGNSLFITGNSIGVFDISTFDGLSLISPTLNMTTNASITYASSVSDVAHSLRVYKGKMFLLGRERLSVGTLLTWADRILGLAQSNCAEHYYTDQAPGNRNGLPEEPSRRKEVIGDKLRSLMDASVRYAFAEERLTDETHVTPDHRGVDLTSLFEGLVTTCCRACIVLDDFDFLFEDLFQCYDDNCIAPIYLRQLEPFILDSSIQHVPPRITQRLVALHEADGQSEYVERLIWHMDPACLDLNQTILLCQKFHLYDALIYIYTRALQDYVAPVVELLGLIRQVQQYRHKVATAPEGNFESFEEGDIPVESLLLSAYKIYPYLSNVLSGLSYPTFRAKRTLYKFLFFGRSSIWPEEGGKLVLTADEEGGLEPTYPYARQLLRFDAESFLHSLDIAFEDAYLNDESQNVNRLIIVRILLEILSDGHISSEDVTLVNIFVARNVPKYPQFLQIAPSVLHNILTGLAEDPDFRTREDRQLAAEYLLSVYNPHDIGTVTSLFEEAGFYRILRTWYRHDRRWALLLCTYRHNKGSLPSDVAETLADSLPQLLNTSIRNTAIIIDIHYPPLHQDALSILHSEFQDKDHPSYVYLRQLLAPPSNEDEEVILPQRPPTTTDIPASMREEFVDLQSRLHPESLVDVLKEMDRDSLQWQQVIDICERNEAWDTVVWALNWQHEPQAALKKAETYYKQLTRRIIHSLEEGSPINREIGLLNALGLTGRDICLERSQGLLAAEVPLEDLCVQTFPRLFKRLVNSTPTATGTQYTEFRLILGGMLESYHSDEDMLAISKHLVDRDLFETISHLTAEKSRGWSPAAARCSVCRKPIIQPVPRASKPLSGTSSPSHLTLPHIVVSRTGIISHSACLSIPEDESS
ncbi:lateendosome to vacuole transport-family protein [Ephemerocybe angulata]|uniref:Lateendosome to vacuole transport-family protein n=1 Tax=Ephemerocybe angulata TaxID=980116 RepID=A0A8H6MF96_9AGAR|nr:lateendosome to vacuole transport-family protein [Tulosesus angulatus]